MSSILTSRRLWLTLLVATLAAALLVPTLSANAEDEDATMTVTAPAPKSGGPTSPPKTTVTPTIDRDDDSFEKADPTDETVDETKHEDCRDEFAAWNSAASQYLDFLNMYLRGVKAGEPDYLYISLLDRLYDNAEKAKNAYDECLDESFKPEVESR